MNDFPIFPKDKPAMQIMRFYSKRIVILLIDKTY